jgi:hypothetical protein
MEPQAPRRWRRSGRDSSRSVSSASKSADGDFTFLLRPLYLLAAVEEEAALPPDMQARLARMLEVIGRPGSANLPRDRAKPLEGKLWELRIAENSQRELELARRRAKEVE